MRKQAQSLAARIKKALTSLIVLLIFLFPAFMTARWVKDVVAGNDDSRVVYTRDEIKAFNATNCSAQAGDIRPFDEPMITITFDDGWESIYSSGLPILEKYCIKSTQYILGDHYSDPLYLSLDQAYSFEQAGHELASHTMTHPDLTRLSAGDMHWELSESHRLLNNEFGGIREFASPMGANNPEVLAVIKKYYRSHRNTAGDRVNIRQDFNPYQIYAYTVRDTTDSAYLQALIDKTIQQKGWLVLTYHQVDNSDAFYAVTKDELDQQMQLVKKSGLKTLTMGQFLDAWDARGERR